jgi:hypothetical protein
VSPPKMLWKPPADDAPVSKRSRYGDATWDFSEELAPRRLSPSETVLHFDGRLADGTLLTEPRNAPLLDDFQTFLGYKLLDGGADGKSPPTTIVASRKPMYWLNDRLVLRGHRSLASLCLKTADDIVRETISHKPPQTAEDYVAFLLEIWRLRDLLSHPPLDPPAAKLISSWRSLLPRKRNPPTTPLEPEQAMMLGGFAVDLFRKGSAALSRLSADRASQRLRDELRRLHPGLALNDVLGGCYVTCFLQAYLRRLEVVTLPLGCIADLSVEDDVAALHAILGTRWRGANRIEGTPACWAASRLVREAAALLERLAELHGQSTIIFIDGAEGCRPASGRDLYSLVGRVGRKSGLKTPTGEPVHVYPRLLRSTGSMLPTHFGVENLDFLSGQLQHPRGSRVTAESYGRMAPKALEREVENSPLDVDAKYGAFGVSEP